MASTDDPDLASGASPSELRGEGHSPIEEGRPGLPWKAIVVTAGGFALTVAGTVLATLAATHKSARHENASAYAHGLLAAVEAIRNGYDPFYE